MNKCAAAILVLAFCVGASGTASAKKYALSCHGPHLGSASAPVDIMIDTASKEFQVGGAPATDVAVDGENVTAMKETEMYQVSLSSMEGVVMNDAGLSNFQCQKK